MADELVVVEGSAVHSTGAEGGAVHGTAHVAGLPANLFGVADPDELVAQAHLRARALAKVLRSQPDKLVARIEGKEYVRLEGWTLLGSMLGVFPVTVWSREVPGGYEARVEARTLSGAVVGAAEAVCKRDESNWEDKPDYQLRSMAQTRAAAKALRQCLGFVLVFAGYNTTPAEEAEAMAQARTLVEEPDAPTCPEHNTRLRRREGGISKKTGRRYPPFWSCPAPGCRTVIWDREAASELAAADKVAMDRMFGKAGPDEEASP